jgi:hypothetical protein
MILKQERENNSFAGISRIKNFGKIEIRIPVICFNDEKTLHQ